LPAEKPDRPAEESGSVAIMPITPKRFFDFCAGHVPLLHAIATRPGDVSEAQVRQMIRSFSDTTEEQPETTWQRLLELQILMPLEEGSSHYVMAQPLLQLIQFMHDEAVPTSPEIIQGYSAALESARKRIEAATEMGDALSVAMAAHEVDHTLRRMQNDLDATHRAVMAEVARYKADRSSVACASATCASWGSWTSTCTRWWRSCGSTA
jgi:hypothetical protein